VANIVARWRFYIESSGFPSDTGRCVSVSDQADGRCGSSYWQRLSSLSYLQPKLRVRSRLGLRCPFPILMGSTSGNAVPGSTAGVWCAVCHLQSCDGVRITRSFSCARSGRRLAHASPAVSFSVGSWLPLGPVPLASDASGNGTQHYHQVAGRATAVAIDPADYIGNTVSRDSGAWPESTGGMRWENGIAPSQSGRLFERCKDYCLRSGTAIWFGAGPEFGRRRSTRMAR